MLNNSSDLPNVDSLMVYLCVRCSNASAFQYAAPKVSANYGTEHDMNVGAEEEVTTCVRLPPSLPEIVKTHTANLPTFCSNDVRGVQTTR